MHRHAGRADGGLGFEPPDGLTGSLPSFSVQPSRIARAPSPRVRPSLVSISSAIVKQSWVSTSRCRRAGGGQRLLQASAGRRGEDVGRLIGRKS